MEKLKLVVYWLLVSVGNFGDTDLLIEEAIGLTIPEIFAEYGQHTFRFSEKKLVEKLEQLYRSAIQPQKTNNSQNSIQATELPVHGTIISTGGGLPAYGDNLAILLRMGTLVGLYASIDVLAERIAKKPNRPLLNPTGLSSSNADQQLPLKSLVEGRKHFYAQANISIDTGDLTPSAIVESIKKQLGLLITV